MKNPKLIEVRPTTTGMSAFVGRSRVRVSDVARLAALHHPDAILETLKGALPQLTKRELNAALDYWHQHPSEISGEIEQEEATLGKS